MPDRGWIPFAGQRKEHLAVVVGDGRIAGFVTRRELVPSFRHGAPFSPSTKSPQSSEREWDMSSPSGAHFRNGTCDEDGEARRSG
jgi:hypothetical protein